MTTDEVVELIKSIGSTRENVQLQIGGTFGDYTVLESLQEIEDHAAQIEVPFSIKLDGLAVDFSRDGCTISFEDSQQALAKSLEKRLEAYRPWYNTFFDRQAALAVFSSLILLLSYGYINPNLTLYEVAVLVGGAFFFVKLIFMLVSQKFIRSTIVHVERNSFWSRNSDKIWLGVIMLLIGAVLRELLLYFAS